MTTYTVINDGFPVRRGLSLQDAADERLSHDGHEYRLVKVDGIWECHVRNPHMQRPFSLGYTGHGNEALTSFADDEATAWAEICWKVIHADWRGVPDVMTDEAYDATCS